MLTLMLRYNHSALNNLCNLLCRHHKKILNWGDLSIKLRYLLEKKIFMENKNILPIFYEIFYGSQEEGFLIPTWLMIGMKMLVRNHERPIRIYNIFLIVLLPRIVKINGVNTQLLLIIIGVEWTLCYSSNLKVLR